MPVRLKDIVTDCQPVTSDMLARTAFNLFSSSPDLSAIPVVKGAEVCGLVTRVRLSEALAGTNGQALLGSRKIAHLMERRFASAELDVPVAAIAKQAADNNSSALTDGVVALQDGEYAGIVPAKAILKVVAEENAGIEAAQNEVTEQARKSSHLLATLSHEIRTPLTGVLGVADLLVDSPLPKESRRYAKTIASSGRLLDRLLTDMLDLSRMEAGSIYATLQLRRATFGLPRPSTAVWLCGFRSAAVQPSALSLMASGLNRSCLI